MGSFDDLPDEIIIKIFLYFPYYDLRVLRECCQRWRCILDEDLFYKVMVADERIPTGELMDIVERKGSVFRRLALSTRSDMMYIAPLMFRCINLQTLIISLCCGDCEDDILCALSMAVNLNVFVMLHSSCVKDTSKLFAVLGQRRLRQLNVRNAPNKILEADLAGLKHVEDLRLKSVLLEITGLPAFCAANEDHLTTLKLLTACENPFFIYDVDNTIFAALQRCTNLRSLSLGHQIMTQASDAGLRKIASLKLESLAFHHAIHITSDGLSSFLMGMSNSLRKVALYDCRALDEQVSNAVATCIKLLKFTCEPSRGFLHKFNAVDLLSIAANCRELKVLHLYGMDLSISSILHLLPTFLVNLEKVVYSNNEYPVKVPQFVMKLNEQMPDFEIKGMQYKYHLYVKCLRVKPNTKGKEETIADVDDEEAPMKMLSKRLSEMVRNYAKT